MTKVIVSNYFLKFKKHSHKNLQIEIDNQVKNILDKSNIGEMKKGDLKGIRVHKFKCRAQLYLLSYEVKGNTLYLYTLGSHENHYKRLKKYLF
ncbi:MAG: type II toxin-antitoxin system RelE/ParE family toxin [bacterium]